MKKKMKGGKSRRGILYEGGHEGEYERRKDMNDMKEEMGGWRI